MKKWAKTFILWSLICAPGAAVGHDEAAGIVKERMELMKAMGQSMKSLGMVFKGQADYDPAVIEQAARDIQALSGTKMTALFPKGSLDHPSEALPAIWKDWPEFKNFADLTESYSDALAKAANNPPDDSGMGFGEMGKGSGDLDELAGQAPLKAFGFLARTCSNCHKAFRMKKN